VSPNPLKIGQVTERDPAKALVRVVFRDLGELVSWWMPILQAKTLVDQVYWMPDEGEHVVCLLDEHAEFGVVIGAIYSDATAPPVSSLEKFHVKFKDGTEIEYDRGIHKLRVSLEAAAADVEISTTRAVTITSSSGDVTVNVADGQHVFLGGSAGALALATEKHVEEIYMLHKHPTPVGLSGPPVTIGGELTWPHVTDKAVAR
jgi:phage baseplate assembly protein V